MNYLIHYNHNHDRLGRFARSSGGSSKTYIGEGGSGRNGKITKRDIKNAKKQRKKEAREFRNISDEELKRRIDRLAAEKRYKELANADVHAGRIYTQELLKSAGKTAVNKSTGQTVDLIFGGIKKQMNIKQEDINKAKAMAMETRNNDFLNDVYVKGVKVQDLNNDKKSLKKESYAYPDYARKKKRKKIGGGKSPYQF